MSDAGAAEGTGANEDSFGGFTPDLASFNENLTGISAVESAAIAEAAAGGGPIGADTPSGADPGGENNVVSKLTVNEPKVEPKTVLKKRDKRRSLLENPSNNVYRRSIF